jgi:hypothetical protein
MGNAADGLGCGFAGVVGFLHEDDRTKQQPTKLVRKALRFMDFSCFIDHRFMDAPNLSKGKSTH